MKTSRSGEQGCNIMILRAWRQSEECNYKLLPVRTQHFMAPCHVRLVCKY